MQWGTSRVREKQIMREPSIKYWNKLRIALRRRHIPPYYERVNEQALKTPTKKLSMESKTSSSKCFKCLGKGHIASQCPTKKTMILRGKGIYNSDSILENIYSLIMDSGSCNNFCSSRLVNKLNLTLIDHRKAYKLQWLNEDGPLKVKEQVNIFFSIGKYKDKVLCDIIPMETSHVLIGRPWQYDQKAIHNGFTNKISLTHMGKKYVLTPLSPSQVLEDQLIMTKTI
uniref:CCHC-type domain-containing protein n=1 Tax=Cajanus cajan TaxID=3821 RepID=A0A151TA51_CAJCA|nr:hypothetical protein KK1_018492 [Cajanus cajan]